MKFLRLLLGLSAAALLTDCARRPTKLEIYDVVINHVTVVDVVTGQLKPNQVVTVSKGKIVGVDPADKDSYAAKQYVNGNGRFLIPGLWDMHVHFRGGDSLIAANKKSLTLFLAHGITTVRDAGGDLTPSVMQWRQEMEAGKFAGPHIFTSGPKIDGPQAYWPGSLEVETPAQVRKALDSLQRLHVDYVKIYDSKISGEAYLNTISQAQKRGLKTTGHMPYSVTLGEAVKRGLDATEHLYYVFKACSGKEDSLTTLVRNSLKTPKPLGLFAVLPAVYDTYSPAAAERIFKLMAKHHTAAVPTLYIGKTLSELPENDHSQDTLRAYIDPKIQATYTRRLASARQQSAEAQAFSKKLEVKFFSLVPLMQAAGVPILAGSDSGPFNSFIYPGASLQDELILLVQAGLTPAQALQAATINGAKFMGVADRTGTIAPGKDADLLLLTANPLENIANVKRIDAVVSRGKAYPAAALSNMLRAIRNR
ncbi:amidohydrolase family protein [Hymenobacter sp. BT770]|uniref:amidohydrolase family protein n=1 Tax=Hymenobacter sp. BT770 TaxID=2886942 RepID=UPI001D105DE5|nr:amidohydrolase family protein [Hymenobacter sp. BT770]MCC3153623.1 amidohydrolase family protein [Hymenobacter sp. BT770]MDO3415911.1 amidohydrolase family protein [Hymenobacter sp. BT770]